MGTSQLWGHWWNSGDWVKELRTPAWMVWSQSHSQAKGTIISESTNNWEQASSKDGGYFCLWGEGQDGGRMTGTKTPLHALIFLIFIRENKSYSPEALLTLLFSLFIWVPILSLFLTLRNALVSSRSSSRRPGVKTGWRKMGAWYTQFCFYHWTCLWLFHFFFFSTGVSEIITCFSLGKPTITCFFLGKPAETSVSQLWFWCCDTVPL